MEQEAVILLKCYKDKWIGKEKQKMFIQSLKKKASQRDVIQPNAMWITFQ